MRRLIAAMLILSACGGRSARSVPDEANEVSRSASIDDLKFNDAGLDAIAADLVREARSRGIETASGRNRVERLLSLEASVRSSELALTRVNKLIAEMTMTDASQWAKLRQRAEREFANRNDEVGRRVSDMLKRWQRQRMDIVFRYLSSNYSSRYITSLEWERRFHDFVLLHPVDAATWGWLVLRTNGAVIRQQYGRSDSEMAYRYYLESSGLGDGREARDVFSVPAIAVDAR